MKLPEYLKGAKETLIKKATTGKGVYITEQIPYIGDYVFARSVSRVQDEKADKTICTLYSLCFGTARVVGIGMCVLGGFPTGSFAVNGILGVAEGANTRQSRIDNGYKHIPKNNSLKITQS